jgi:hypothetical protein
MHWEAVGRGLAAAGGLWLAALALARVQVARRARRAPEAPEGGAGEGAGPEKPPEAPRRAWAPFVAPVLALAVGLLLMLIGPR